MTSLKRIRKALEHREPDKLPIDFGGMRSTGIQAIAYNRLLKHLGINDEKAKVYDVFQQLAEPSPEVVEKLNGDVYQVHRLRPAFGIDILGWREGTLPDGSDCLFPDGYVPVPKAGGGEDILVDGTIIASRPEGGLYFDQMIHPYADVQTRDDVNRVPLAPVEDAEIRFVSGNARALRADTDKALLFAFGGNILEAGQLDFGYETFYMNLALQTDLMNYYFGRLADSYISALDALMPSLAPSIDLIQFGDDLGTQVAPQISPEMYRTMIKLWHRKLFTHVRDRWPEVKNILQHFMDDKGGWDPVTLKNEFGKDLVFWGGGADMQQTVAKGSIPEIRDEVRRLIDIFSRDGGYVFTQVHNIQADVSPDKVMAIYETAAEYR